MGRDAADSSARPGSNVGPDGGLKRLPWIFMVTTSNVRNWRVARHGSLQQNKENMQIRVNAKEAHLPVFVHTAERSARDCQTIQKEARRRTAPKKRQACAPETPNCDGCCDAGRGCGPGQRSSGPSEAYFTSSPDVRRFVSRALLTALSTSPTQGAYLCFFLKLP